MELIRELVRDLVGIIFPGGLLVIFTLWLFFSITIIFVPPVAFDIFAIADNTVGFVVLLIFSYVTGQSLRLRRLGHLESECTKEYRKKYKSKLSQKAFDDSVENLRKEEQAYYAGQSTFDKLREVYEKHADRFQIWEEFPYPYHIKARRLSRQSSGYNEFFEKYDRQEITKYERFFNFCKSVTYEYSPSLKEELIRQESLVRLFSGIYYAIKYGKAISVLVGSLHLVMLLSFYLSKVGFLSYAHPEYFYVTIAISVFAYWVFWYLNREILDRLRLMRTKELDLAFDAFYVVCKKNNLAL